MPRTPLTESYADELMDGTDLSPHGGNAGQVGHAGHADTHINMYAWLMIVGAVGALWLLGGVAFKSVNQ